VAAAAILLIPSIGRSAGGTADEIHYTFTGPTSVAFDWRGTATDISYGPTSAYGTTVTAHTPNPVPFSSPGPFWEADLTGLTAGTTYHYSVGGSPDQTFTTVPTGNFRFDSIADVSSSLATSKMTPTMAAVAADNPAFVLVNGDLTYANEQTQSAADQHFNDVMVWSQSHAYMPAWGNHEWETPANDDLRNYKGRFELPNAQTALGAPSLGCCGEDWDWFDAGGVRFISYPEPYTSGTWSDWQTKADPIMAAAQADPSINYIVTYGHRPAYSTGAHPGDPTLATILDAFGARYPKYVLDLNGHSHNYERFLPINGVTHITTGASTSLDPNWSGTDPRTAVRMLHTEHLRIDVTPTSIHIDAVCGPSSSLEDTTCAEGAVGDSYTIGPAPPPPTHAPVLYVDRGNAACSDSGPGSAAQPFCTIRTAALVAESGQTVQVASGTYNDAVSVAGSGTSGAPIAFTSAPGTTVTLTGPTSGFSVAGKSWITINGFNVTATNAAGILVSNSSNITISNNHVSFTGQPVSGETMSGISLDGVTNSTVSGNTVDHTSSYGILLNNSSGNQVRGNTSFANAQSWQRAASGIRVYASTGNTFSSNITHDNEDSGIEFDGAANNNLVVNNLTYLNGDHGIDDLSSTGIRIIGNTVYRNVTAGINVEGNSTGATIRNNISVDNGIASPRSTSNIRIETGSTAGTTLDYDLVSISSADALLRYDSVSYTSLAAFQTATGQEQHGLQANPGWRDPANGDFHLTGGSPAIDSADSGASGQMTVDLEGVSRVDDPATVNTGAGPRTYDDRGAYEWNAAPLDHIAISPASATIFAGGSQLYTAQGFDQSNNPMGDMTASTTFTISPDGSCTANSCTTSTPGPHTVTGTAAGKTATATLNVTGGLDHITVSPSSATVTAGSPQTFTAQGFDGGGNSLGDVTSTTSFSITPDGSCSGATCTPANGGAHVVTANNGGKTATANLNADYVKNAGFETNTTGWNTSGSGANITLTRVSGGHSGGFAAQIKNTGTSTSTYAVIQDSPNWVTTTTAGKYSATLWVRADSPGATFKLKLQEYSGSTLVGSASAQTTLTTAWQQVTVSYTAGAGRTLDFQAYTSNPAAGSSFYADDASVVFGTTAPTLDHITIAPATASISSGGSQTYTAQGFDAQNNSLGDVTANTTFTISPNGSCAAATCTATQTGAHTVTGTDSGKTATATLDVQAQGGLDHITISPASATVKAGSPQTYTAQGFDSGGNSLGDVTASTTFTISPDGSCAGATCTPANGGPHTVTGTSAGKTATASLNADYVKNGDFESNTNGWNTSSSGANIALARVAGGHSGGFSAQVKNTGTTTSTYAVIQDSPNWVGTTVAGKYTATLWVRADAAGAVFKLKLQEYNGNSLVGSAVTQVTLTTDWQQVTVTYTAGAGRTLDLQAYTTNPTAGSAFYVDDASILFG
jgi:parallel beta-helix repeat protein